jgi:hypothetical protein
VVSEHPSYSSENVGGEPLWAEPDIAEAAACMRALHDDPDRRRSLGEQAARDMKARRDEYIHCAVWDQLRDMVLDHDSALWNGHAARIERLTRV